MIQPRRPSARISAAASMAVLGVVVLASAPMVPAAAVPHPADAAIVTRIGSGASLAGEGDHATVEEGDHATVEEGDHATVEEGDEGSGVAPWPEWAKTGAPAEEHAHDSTTPGGAGATSDSDSQHATHGGGSADTGTDVPSTGADSTEHGGQGHDSGSSGTGGHDEEVPVQPRPRALVLGSFAAVNAGVLLAAAFIRRRTRSEVQRRKSARAAALRGTAKTRSPQPAAPAQPQH